MAGEELKPVAVFENGALYLHTMLERVRVRWDAAPKAEKKDARGYWREHWPDMPVIARPLGKRVAAGLDARGRAKADAYALFRACVPRSLCRLVQDFQSHQWQLLQLINRSSPALELAEANPVLAYALANNYEFRRTSAAAAAEQAVYHSHQKQKEICAWLGFPERPAIVRLLGRIRPDAVSPSLLRRLRTALKRNERVLKLLSHHPSVSVGVLEMVATPELVEIATPKLLEEIASIPDEAEFFHTADHLYHAIRQVTYMGSDRRIPRFSSVRKIEEFAEEVDREYLEYERRQEEARAARAAAIAAAAQWRREARVAAKDNQKTNPRKAVWPPPPVPGTAAIIPITSYNMLREEGSIQSNCVGSYWREVLNLGVYIYRVLEPERATVSLVSRPGGVWHVSQVKLAYNRQASMATRAMVRSWLYANTLSA